MNKNKDNKTKYSKKLGTLLSDFRLGDNNSQKNSMTAWQKIIDDYDKPAYRVEAFHELADNIMKSALGLKNKIQAAEKHTGQQVPSQNKNEIIQMLQSKASFKNDLTKLAADASKVSRFARAAPVVGLLFSLPLFIKNLIESWNNGIAIASELPLEKYGISKAAAFSPNPAAAAVLIYQLNTAIKNNRENPEALYDILEITKTIAAFWLDVWFAFTNGVMVVIDAIALLVVWFPIDGPVLDAIAGTVGGLITLALVGGEFGAEWLSHKTWEGTKLEIKRIAENKIKEQSLMPTQPKTYTKEEIEEWWNQQQSKRFTPTKKYTKEEIEEWWNQQQGRVSTP